MSRKIVRIFAVLIVIIFSVLIILKPEICRNGAFSGLVICGRVIIPSLFPFTMCVIYIVRSGVLKKLEFLKPITTKILRLSSYETCIVVLSLIGGYPVGAKMLNSAVENGEINSKRAGEMLTFCVNAGPAFIVSAVGSGILNSAKLGYILLLCHLFANLFLLMLFGRREKKIKIKPNINNESIADGFVFSVADAANSVISICTFVILFSVVTQYLRYYSQKIKCFYVLAMLSEITNAVTKTNNLYIISFLLGFSGFCVWCQIFSVSKRIKINYFKFFLSRILHGVFSVCFLYAVLKIFKISVKTGCFEIKYTYSTPVLTISMLLMCIVFAISLAGKNYSGKISEDMI